jgi:TolB protein
MKIRYLTIFILLLFLLVSCVSGASPEASPTTTSQPSTQTVPLVPTKTLSPPTQTAIPPTETALPTSTSTKTVPAKETDIPPTETHLPTGTPTLLPPLSGAGGGVIAFTSERDGNNEIYFMNLDGSDLQRLTDHPFSDVNPMWSPDGTKIAFVSSRERNRDIFIVHRDGSNLQQLTEHPSDDLNPVWFPDGSKIGFVSVRDGNAEIYQINIVGSGLQRLTQNTYDDWEFEWSPDGTQMAISSQKTGSANIFLANSDGSGDWQQLTDTGAHNGYPRWSPDGSQIVFASNRDNNWEIYLMNNDGSNQKRLTNTDAAEGPASWSPDGTQLIFDSGPDNDKSIFVMDSDGANIHQITDDGTNDWGPVWQPKVETETSETSNTRASDPASSDELKLTIIYDNYLQDDRLTAEWGFAALVEYRDHVLLFDTGGSTALLDNMQILGIDPQSIEAVVLSHEHWDHIGGLLPFLEVANQPIVYLLPSFPYRFKNSVAALTEMVEVSDALEIFPGIYTTGEVTGGGVQEQALAIQTDQGSVIITGCAHPGVNRMVRMGRSALQPGIDVEYTPVSLVVGGFHLGSTSQSQIENIIENLQSMDVKQISPTHCTGDAAIAIFAEVFGDDYIPGGAGKEFILP